jgi:hypothetical protein
LYPRPACRAGIIRKTRLQSVKFQDILDTLFQDILDSLFQDILDSFGVCKERVESGFWEYLGGG